MDRPRSVSAHPTEVAPDGSGEPLAIMPLNKITKIEAGETGSSESYSLGEFAGQDWPMPG